MTSLNLVPISALSSRGVISGSIPEVAPAISSVVNSCCVDFTGASARETAIATSRLTLPTKLNLPSSKRTPDGFQFLIRSMPRWTSAMVEPSLGAMLNM